MIQKLTIQEMQGPCWVSSAHIYLRITKLGPIATNSDDTFPLCDMTGTQVFTRRLVKARVTKTLRYESGSPEGFDPHIRILSFFYNIPVATQIVSSSVRHKDTYVTA
jgi:hypothetical protein